MRNINIYIYRLLIGFSKALAACWEWGLYGWQYLIYLIKMINGFGKHFMPEFEVSRFTSQQMAWGYVDPYQAPLQAPRALPLLVLRKLSLFPHISTCSTNHLRNLINTRYVFIIIRIQFSPLPLTPSIHMSSQPIYTPQRPMGLQPHPRIQPDLFLPKSPPSWLHHISLLGKRYGTNSLPWRCLFVPNDGCIFSRVMGRICAQLDSDVVFGFFGGEEVDEPVG